MKRMKWLIAAAAVALVPAAGLAQTALPDADPALWVVKDEDTTVYLFGTFHLLDGKRDWFNDEVKAAFDASDALVIEAIMPENPAELQPLVIRYAVDPDGKTLASQLPEEQQAELTAALASVGAPPNALDQFEPWFASMTLATLAMQKLGLKPEHGPETILTAAAKQRNLPIAELESVEYQLGMLDGMPREMQLEQLEATLEQFDEIADELAPMVAAWSDGEVDRLVGIMNEHLAEHPELYDILFTQRNASWAEWVDKRLDEPGTVFVAVGAGHLAGEGSVQALLEERGIAATRVAAE